MPRGTRSQKADDASPKDNPPRVDSLAGVSGRAMEAFLAKAGRRSGSGRRDTSRASATAQVAGLPPARRQPAAAGDCGAPALASIDAKRLATEPEAAADALADAVPDPAHDHDFLHWEEDGAGGEHQCAAQNGDEEHCNMVWEEAELSEPEQEISFVLDEVGAQRGAEKPPPRPRITKAQREHAQLLHRAHLLCLLARGRLYDQAADNPLVQGLMLSLVDDNLLPAVHPQQGVAAPTLRPLLSWFQSTFNCVPPPATEPSTDEYENLQAQGLAATVGRLTAVAGERSGSAEELTALLVALLRAHGLLARLIRALDPLPLSPAGLKRQTSDVNTPRGFKRCLSQPAGNKGYASELQEQVQGKQKKSRGRLKAGDADVEAAAAVAASPAANGRLRKTASGKSSGAKRKVEAAQERNTAGNGTPEAIDREDSRRRKGDLEFEQQLAMAMAATGFAPPPDSTSSAPSNAISSGPLPKAASAPAGMSGGGGVGAAAGQLLRRGSSGKAWGRQLDETRATDFWAEVYCGPADVGRWVHAAPLIGQLDAAGSVEGLVSCRLAYVVAFANGGCRDVTQRYTGSFLQAEKLRDSEWWAALLAPLRRAELATRSPQPDIQPPQRPMANSSAGAPRTAMGDGGRVEKLLKAHEMRLKREDAELQEKVTAQKRGLPTTIDSFRHHSLYVLERHITKYQALTPGTRKAGLHRGEAYYERSALVELHTAEKWLQQGREVLQAELGAPHKEVARRGSKQKKGSGTLDEAEQDAEEEEELGSASPSGAITRLYGRWQTRQWTPPTAVAGVVPKNERGTVHCPPFAAAIPTGTVHLKLPRLSAVCKKLGVDYAPAMTGFEIRAGRSVPTFEGVVVCQEAQDMVLDAHRQEERARAERAEQKARHEADAAWRQLLRSILARVRVQQSYGALTVGGSGRLRSNWDGGTNASGGRSGSEAAALAVERICLDGTDDGGGDAVAGNGRANGHGAGSIGSATATAAAVAPPFANSGVSWRESGGKGVWDGKRKSSRQRQQGSAGVAADEQAVMFAAPDAEAGESGQGPFKQQRVAGMLLDVEEI